MEYVIIGLLALILVLLLVLLLRRPGDGSLNAISGLGQALQNNQRTAAEAQQRQLQNFGEQTAALLKGQTESVKDLKADLTERVDRMDRKLNEDQRQFNTAVNDKIGQLQQSLANQMDQFREMTVNQNLTQQREINTLTEQMGQKLDEIRGTVDEKLQTTLEKRISESFKTVSEQLEQVYRGLGEMQNLAGEVGGLKKVLSGVKTRGILGEIQLGAILEEILSPEQYETNVAVIPGSSERVEFAVKLPGGDGTVWLPIDSKFPGERYAQLVDARESGDRETLETARKNLEAVLKSEAADIRHKYVEVPYTTNFGIMFLPFEGLYAEVVSSGLMETLQRSYQVSVAGPSTMAALLNSLQMGFRTLAIQKRSNEVWEVLGAVRTEFDKFGGVMQSMQRHLNQTSEDLEKLMTTRSRAITRRLSSIQKLDDTRSETLLGLNDPGESSLPESDE